MPAKEIKALRQEGKLEEALSMAKAELEADPNNVWGKRNISWVFYEYLKQNSAPEQFDSFIFWLNEIRNLHLPEEEKMLFDQVCWVVGKMVFNLLKSNSADFHKGELLFDALQSLHFSKPSEGYSFLFKALHKFFKDSESYLKFADWWDFRNFMQEDYQKGKLPNGKEVMALAEQAYIAYAKHLLPVHAVTGEIIFNKEKAAGFLPVLSEVVENYPKFLYPAYFNAKLLLALGDKDNLLESLLPFAKKKRNDFWVWEIMAEAFIGEPDKVFACYCKALSCNSPEEMLINLRQKMAGLFISKKLYNEAKTEIDLLVKARNEQGYKIPNEVVSWQSQDWYKIATSQKNNFEFYMNYSPAAESILYSDTPEESVIVEFVNTDKQILNFIASESKFGFFKYDRFFKEVKVGETLKVRFQGGSNQGMHHLLTAMKSNDESFKQQFFKEVSGVVKVLPGKAYGFLDDVYIHPSIVKKLKLADGMLLSALAIKSYNGEKMQWSWKLT